MQTHFSLGTHFSQSAPQTKWRHSSSPVSTYSSTNLKIRKIYLPLRANGKGKKQKGTLDDPYFPLDDRYSLLDGKSIEIARR